MIFETEADPRHAELIVQEMCVKGGKGVDTSDVKDSPEDELSLPVTGQEIRKYRSVTMRAAYLAVDRADISNTVKNAAKNMQAPRICDFPRLKKLA